MAFRFVLNPGGVRDLLRSEGVRADLEARAQRVAAAANDGDAEYHVDSTIGRNRARATVATGNIPAMVLEAREHRLAQAIDAARG